MEKRKYETPELEVICFNTEDIITTSGINNGIIGDPDFDATAPDFGWGEWP